MKIKRAFFMGNYYSMSELFKDIYNQAFYQQFADVVNNVIEGFSTDSFINKIFDESFDGMELKARMAHTSSVLHYFLGDDFDVATKQIIAIIGALESKGLSEKSIEYMFFPHYIEQFGLDEYESAVVAFERITQFTSCEFAVRPFLVKYPESMLTQMTDWSKHSHASVRRLASEGARPRLPWAMGLPAYKENPAPLLPILMALRNDEDEIVRRSVANNLNDIAKDNPDFVVNFAQQHGGESVNTDKLIKHACRTLLKQGHPAILSFYGLSCEHLSVDNLVIECDALHIGESLAFEFDVTNHDVKSRKVRLEYAVHYRKKNGQLAPKVFKISERDYGASSTMHIQRKQSFKVITTRVFHVGGHRLSIIVNGQTFVNHDFELLT